MADTFKTIKVTQNPGGPLQQQLVGAVETSVGAADAGKVVLLNSAGQLDPSMGGGGGGSVSSVNGFTGVVVLQLAQTFTPIANEFLTGYSAGTGVFTAAQPSFANLSGSIATGQIPALTITVAQINATGTPSATTFLRGDGSWVVVSSGSSAFNTITTGTNTTATMTVGSGASIVTTGTGVIEATELATTGAPVVVSTAAPPTSGQVLTATSPTAANWQTPGGGGGSSRTTAVITTAMLNPNAVESGTVSLAKTFSAIKVVVNVPSRLRLYSTTGARDADVNRPPDVPPDPATQNGVIIDIVLNANTGVSWILNPTALGDDGQTVPTGIIGYNVNNSSGVAQSVVWTITYLPMET